MSIELTKPEQALHDEISERWNKVKEAMGASRYDVDTRTLIMEAGERSHKLHMMLKKRELEPKHHAYVIKNRGMQPDNKEFYCHFHTIEDLLAFIQSPQANDDPKDQTIGAKFKFQVFSHRWGRDDTYEFTRTAEGWEVWFVSIGGPCDKSGQPFLFKNLDHDGIQYPSGLAGLLGWLWEKAASDGLSKQQVQVALQQLADWVSSTEKSMPKNGLWEGY